MNNTTMDYFIFRNALKKIGYFPQLTPVLEEAYKTEIENVMSFDLWGGNKPNLKLPPLEPTKKSVIFTDVFSCTSMNTNEAVLLSEKGISVIRPFLDENSIIYNLQVKKGGKFVKHYYIFLDKVDNNFIDFDKSLFVKKLIRSKYPDPAIGKLFKYKNHLDYEVEVKRKHHEIIAHQLFLNKEKIQKHIFRIRGAVGALFFSEDVVKTIKKNKLTGVDFIPESSLYFNTKYVSGYYQIDL